MVHHIVQQIALVADDDNHALIGFQEAFEPQGCFEIEVVRRLIEQQQGGRGKQQGGQRHPHFPAAGIAVQRAALHFFIKAEAHEDAGCAGGRCVGIDCHQSLIDVAQPVRIMAGFAFGQQCRAFGVGSDHGFKRGCGAAWRILRDIADAGGARHFHAAFIWLERANHHLHQRRFARTIAADEADARIGWQGRSRTVKDGPATKADGDSIQGKHGWPVARTAGKMKCHAALHYKVAAVGGPSRNRTGVRGFAVRYVTTPPSGLCCGSAALAKPERGCKGRLPLRDLPGYAR